MLQWRCFFKLNLNYPDQFNFNKELKISFRIKWINKQGSIHEWTGSIFCRFNWEKENPWGYWREKIIKIVTSVSFNQCLYKHWSNLVSSNTFAMKVTRTFHASTFKWQNSIHRWSRLANQRGWIISNGPLNTFRFHNHLLHSSMDSLSIIIVHQMVSISLAVPRYTLLGSQQQTGQNQSVWIKEAHNILCHASVLVGFYWFLNPFFSCLLMAYVYTKGSMTVHQIFWSLCMCYHNRDKWL